MGTSDANGSSRSRRSRRRVRATTQKHMYGGAIGGGGLIVGVLGLACFTNADIDVAACIILAAGAVLVGGDFAFRRRKRLLQVRTESSVDVLDGSGVRATSRRRFHVVKPSILAIAVLVALLAATLSTLRTLPHVELDREIHLAVVFVVASFLGSALWAQLVWCRVKIRDERWGTWFDRRDVASILPEMSEADAGQLVRRTSSGPASRRDALHGGPPARPIARSG